MPLRPSRLINAILAIGILLALLPTLTLGGSWLIDQYLRFNESVSEIRAHQVLVYKERIKTEVQHAVRHINYMRTTVRSRLKKDIKSRVLEAHAIATSIVDTSKEKSEAFQKLLVRETLRDVRFSKGRGYYFIINLDSVCELHADRPELEQQFVGDERDSHGKYLVREMIEIARTRGEGFLEYTWTKPGEKEKYYPKIVYLKLFKPFNWILVTGEYLDDVEKDVQKLVLEHLEKMTYGKDGYIFAGQFDGTSLSGPEKGKNMISIRDASGIYITQKLIAAAKQGGGFVQYIMPQFEGKKPLPKLSYAETIDDWHWYVGTGIYIDDIDKTVLQKKNAMMESLKANIVVILAIWLAILLIAAILLISFWRRIRNEITTFRQFFKSTGHSGSLSKLSTDQLSFSEFRSLAEETNRMVAARDDYEQMLLESEERFRLTIDSFNQSLFVINNEYKILIVNKLMVETCRRLGLPTDLIGKDLFKTFPQIQKKIHDIIVNVFAEGHRAIEEATLVVGDTHKIRYRISFFPIFYGESIPAMLTIMEDITAERQQEAERQRLEEQLRQSQKMEAIGRLAGGVAHDFNNLLTGITGNIELAKMDLDPDHPAMESMEDMYRATERATNMTRQLLAFSRKQILSPRPMDLNIVVEDMGRMLHRLIGEDITLVRKLAKDIPRIVADPGQIEQIILNLVVNARDAMPDGGKITISTEVEGCLNQKCEGDEADPGCRVILSLSDTGSGIDPAIRDHIFDPFFTTKARGAGTGLGLSMVYGIIKQHGAKIEVDTELGVGTTFRMIFPGSDADAENQEKQDLNDTLPKGTETILLAEDETIVRTMATKSLQRQGYTVLAAEDGPAALKIAKEMESPPDMLLTDVVMPGMNGKQLADRILEIFPETKVLFASGYTEDTIAHHGVLDKGVEFIAKPYTPQDIIKRVRIVLDK